MPLGHLGLLYEAHFPLDSESSTAHLTVSCRLHTETVYGQSSFFLLDHHTLQMLGWPDTQCLYGTYEKEEVPQIFME